MIGRLIGTIDVTGGNPVIVDVHGVGYAVSVPERTLRSFLPSSSQTLHIHTHIREDALDLYGFLTPEDLALFRLLLTVSGIGPRTALGVMDKGSNAVEQAIRESDVAFFTTIPRLGKKNAQKLIIELKNKLGSLTDLNLKEDLDPEREHLVDALSSMGFARKEILAILPKLDSHAAIEQKIRQALRLLGT